MPLRPGSDKKTISGNISEFHTGKTYAHTAAKFGKERADAQAIAVALNTARKYAAGGGVDDAVEDTNEWNTVPRSPEGRPQITVTKPQEYGLAPHISGILNSLKDWYSASAPIKTQEQPGPYEALDTAQAFPQVAKSVYDSYKDRFGEFKKDDNDQYLADQPVVPNEQGKVPEIRNDYMVPAMAGLDIGSNFVGVPGAAAIKGAAMAGMAAKAAKSFKPLSLTSQLMALNKTHSLDLLLDTVHTIGGPPSAAAQIGVTPKQILKIQDMLESQSPKAIAEHVAENYLDLKNLNSWLPNDTIKKVESHLYDLAIPTAKEQHAENLAKSLLYTNKNDPEGVAHDLFQLAEQNGPVFAENVFKNLPESIRSQVNDHLGQLSHAAGRSPFVPTEHDETAAVISDLEKFFESQNMDSKHLEALVKGLAENPKNHEFDEFIKNYGFHYEHGAPASKPGVVPYKAPEIAKEKGLNIPLSHGTIHPEEFDKFRLPDREIGVHFGTPRAAWDRIYALSKGTYKKEPETSDKYLKAPRIFPVVIKADNPLRLPDMGTWTPEKMQSGLIHHSGLPLHFQKEEVFAARYGISLDDAKAIAYDKYSKKLASKLDIPESTQIANLRKYIKSKGFDSIVYKNYAEDVSNGVHDSYILFDTPEHDPHHVHGVKVPWAKFKDMNDPNLITGLGGILAIPAAASVMQGQDKMNRGGVPKKFAAGGAPSKSEFAPWDINQGAHWKIRQMPHVPHRGGMIKSPIPGRTDKIPLKVPSGAYVMPADSVSALGQNNSLAGADILSKMFKMGPYGSGATGSIRGSQPKTPGFSWMRGPRGPKVSNRTPAVAADGGEQTGDGEEVPIIAAGSEFIIPPDVVKEIGHGDLSAGHRALDKFVLKIRKEHIKVLQGLAPPKK